MDWLPIFDDSIADTDIIEVYFWAFFELISQIARKSIE